MRRLNHSLSIFLSLCVVIAMTACGGDNGRKTVLKFGHGLAVTHPVHLGLERMNEELIRLSDGTMALEIYPAAQLGPEAKCIELLQIGSLDMTKVSSAPLEGFVESFKLFGIPYLFRDHEHFDKALSGEMGEALLESTEPFWFRGVTYFDAGARSLYTTTKPIRTMEDMKGLKIRVQKSPIAVEMIKAFGGSATPVDWGELYTALQSNVVDGAENNTPSITTAFHYEVAKYYTVNEHNFSPDVIIISSKRWATLTEQQRGWIKEAAQIARVYQAEVWAEQEQKSLDIMRENGVEIIYPDKTPFIEASQPMIRKYSKDPAFTEYIKQIEAIQ